jgi:hypothetical protein
VDGGLTPQQTPAAGPIAGDGEQPRVDPAAADRVVAALRAAIRDPGVRATDARAGPIDAVSDNTDLLTRPRLWRRLAALYDRAETDVGERESHGM